MKPKKMEIESKCWYCGIATGKKGLRPASNYGNRFSAGLANGKSTFVMSKEKRKNRDIEICVADDIVIEDEFIKKILYSPVLKDIGKSSVFIEFERPIKKYTAISMPLIDSANSFLAYNELFYAFTPNVTMADYITLTMAKANYGPTRIYKERLKDITEVCGDLDYTSFLDPELLNKQIRDIYVYNPRQIDCSVWHHISDLEFDDNTKDIVNSYVLKQAVGMFSNVFHFTKAETRNLLTRHFESINAKDNEFKLWCFDHVIEIEEEYNKLAIRQSELRDDASTYNEVRAFEALSAVRRALLE